MKAKLSLLIPLLTIVGLVACTAAIPAASTTTVATSNTTTSTVVTPTVAPTVEDFTFFNGLNNGTSDVYDTKSFTKASITCGSDSDQFVRIMVSNDAIKWVEQFRYDGAICRQGQLSWTFSVSGRYYKAESTGLGNVNLIARFSN